MQYFTEVLGQSESCNTQQPALIMTYYGKTLLMQNLCYVKNLSFYSVESYVFFPIHSFCEKAENYHYTYTHAHVAWWLISLRYFCSMLGKELKKKMAAENFYSFGEKDNCFYIRDSIFFHQDAWKIFFLSYFHEMALSIELSTFFYLRAFVFSFYFFSQKKIVLSIQKM